MGSFVKSSRGKRKQRGDPPLLPTAAEQIAAAKVAASVSVTKFAAREAARAAADASRRQAEAEARKARAESQIRALKISLFEDNNHHHPPAKRPRPTRRARAPTPSTPSTPSTTTPSPEPLIPTPMPEYVNPEELSLEGGEIASVRSLSDVERFVDEHILDDVLCCPAAGVLSSWRGLQNLRPLWCDSKQHIGEWEAWASGSSPRVLPLCEALNANVDTLKNQGMHNRVCRPLDSEVALPPQLLCKGFATTAYVARFTRLDPYDGTGESYRGVDLAEIKREVSLTLLAALEGIGPLVYGVFVYKWKGCHGLLMFLEELDTDLLQECGKLCSQYTQREGRLLRPDSRLRSAAEHIAQLTIPVLLAQSACGFINVDTKPANTLLRLVGDEYEVKLTDFDAIHFELCPWTTLRARFFLNALLLVAHVRAWCHPDFSNSFAAVYIRPLLQAYRRMLTGGDHHEKWIFDIKKGSKPFRMEALDEAATPRCRLTLHFEMMTYEYLFNEHKRGTKRVIDWQHWPKPLMVFGGETTRPFIPALLRYALFHNDSVPSEFRDILI